MEIRFTEEIVSLDYLRNYLVDNGIRAVIFGETHSGKYHEIQEELIRRLNPDYLLHEFLWDKKFETPESIDEAIRGDKGGEEEWYEGEGTNICYWENRHVFDWGKRHSLKLIGCDLSFEEQADFEEETEAYPHRKNRMGEVITEYGKQSERPLIAIVGDTHASEHSDLYFNLKLGNVYLIRPVSRNGDVLVGKVFSPSV